MVANAGILRVQSILEITVEDWDRVLAVNARSVMLCFKHAARQMVAQSRGGRLIGGAHACFRVGPKTLTLNDKSPRSVLGCWKSW